MPACVTRIDNNSVRNRPARLPAFIIIPMGLARRNSNGMISERDQCVGDVLMSAGSLAQC
jgi:hypothetical protein